MGPFQSASGATQSGIPVPKIENLQEERVWEFLNECLDCFMEVQVDGVDVIVAQLRSAVWVSVESGSAAGLVIPPHV